ncbi:MAG: L-seryl-tRNA(Ser) seleniumtransferase [Gaiellaceae bacterium]|nr:L-seryl-tRNA(Ser) seleniumtransferase [Gaiellaceae bacterium]
MDELAREVGGPLAVDAARLVIERAREQIRAGGDPGDLVARVWDEVGDARAPRLRRAINATGVVIHTNLGRAPLAEEALRHVTEVARGYSNLEYDIVAGERGSRQDHCAAILQRLTGAEAALVVNNNAAAVLLALAALAEGREVVVSRGELIEIGDGFRIPDVLARSGARLVEVGTTNRTRAEDYENAIGPDTAALLRVHQANFRVVGFEERPSLEEVAEVARRHGLPLVDDLGSGAITPVFEEPTAKEVLAAGADLVCFSGDKLLGGPQAGIILGRGELIEKLRRHPLHRAVRIDKLSLAALEGTLLLHLEAPEQIPVLRTLAQDTEKVRARAEYLAVATGGEVEETVGRVGGGALPLAELPSFACAVEESLAEPLHAATAPPVWPWFDPVPPIVGVVRDGRLLLDCLAVADSEVRDVAVAVAAGRGGWNPALIELITDLDGPIHDLNDVLASYDAELVSRVLGDGIATIYQETAEERSARIEATHERWLRRPFEPAIEPDYLAPEEAVRVARLELEHPSGTYRLEMPQTRLDPQMDGPLMFRYAADDPAAIANVRARAGLE